MGAAFGPCVPNIMAFDGTLTTLLVFCFLHTHGFRSVPIERRHNISLAEFDRDFASTSRPVIISGATTAWPALAWSRADLRRMCGARLLSEPCENGEHSVQIHSDDHTHWAGLEDADLQRNGVRTVADLIDAQDSGAKLYLFDASLDLICPEMLITGAVLAPRYFPEDITEQLPLPWLKQDAGHGCVPRADPEGHGHGFPSIFIGGASTESKLHVDSKCTRFYMV